MDRRSILMRGFKEMVSKEQNGSDLVWDLAVFLFSVELLLVVINYSTINYTLIIESYNVVHVCKKEQYKK